MNKQDITVYRKTPNGNISFWRAYINDSSTGQIVQSITVEHGRLGGVISKETITTHRNLEDEVKSRYNKKLKQGYKFISDIKDNNNSPVERELESYLRTYLPDDRTTTDGSLLPMLAKVFDNKNNRIFKNNSVYIGQWKINGLRCFIRAVEEKTSLFSNISFTFQSREGTYWNSLTPLNNYLLNNLPNTVIDAMLDEDWILDGELYIPGFSINELNHIIKDPTSPYNKFVQFWCYDIYIPDMLQINRNEVMIKELYNFRLNPFISKEEHLNNKQILNVLPSYGIDCEGEAFNKRNTFIDLGFEGLIMRKPDIEYEAGKRKMIKYKKATDGIFTIVDIKPEGIKRPDIPLFVCKNDINDAEFEVHISMSIASQKECLKIKDSLIGKQLFIEYGERSGINQVPFHVKNVVFK